MKTAIEEMEHIEACAEGILFLGGDVKLSPAAEVKKIHEIKGMLELARSMEESSIKEYNAWANECSAHSDAGSRNVFEALVDDEERHWDQYDVEIDHIEKFGDRYLALQSIEGSKMAIGGAEE
jgi:bacterioferritin